MIKISEKDKCCGCFSCASSCPKKCITMKEDNEGFLYPNVDESVCIDCDICSKSCPIISPTDNKKSKNDITAYAAFSKDENIIFNSSSGGIFTHLASKVINSGGVVFGAAFDKNFNVCHICVDNIDELSKLRGSKYLQSSIGNSYQDAKKYLETGKTVYFSGTPCQISGLLKYLNKNYDNLITQDIICHGVPSPKVWNYYLNKRKNVANAEIKEINFRNKSTGWKSYSTNFIFDNNSEFTQVFSKNAYMKAFLANLCLRPSCYNCSFKEIIRNSDITLADFWGIENIMPQMDTDKGTSLIFVNSKKGEALFESIKNDIIYKKTEIDEAVKYNPSAIQSSSLPKKRMVFMNTVSDENFESKTESILKISTVKRIRMKIKNVIKNIVKE